MIINSADDLKRAAEEAGFKWGMIAAQNAGETPEVLWAKVAPLFKAFEGHVEQMAQKHEAIENGRRERFLLEQEERHQKFRNERAEEYKKQSLENERWFTYYQRLNKLGVQRADILERAINRIVSVVQGGDEYLDSCQLKEKILAARQEFEAKIKDIEKEIASVEHPKP